MVKITDIYESATGKSTQIQADDLAGFKTGLTIHKVDIVGTDREGVKLWFKETNLSHKCNRKDVFAICNKFNLTDTDEFVGKKVNFVVVKDRVSIKV